MKKNQNQILLLFLHIFLYKQKYIDTTYTNKHDSSQFYCNGNRKIILLWDSSINMEEFVIW